MRRLWYARTGAGMLLVLLLVMGGPGGLPALAQNGPDKSTGIPQSTIVFWTDGPQLKAVNVVFLPHHHGPVGIVSVPLHACLGPKGGRPTVDEYYRQHGRVKLTRRLGQLFGVPIENYISIDQKTLYQASAITGEFSMAGKRTNLVDVFEGRYVDHRVNLQVEIRQLAAALTTPAMLVKLPPVLWVVATQVETNLGAAQIIDFYLLLQNSGPGVLQKKAVPGRDYRVGGRKLRRVDPAAWSGTLKDVTTRG